MTPRGNSLGITRTCKGRFRVENSATTSAVDPKDWIKNLLNWREQLKVADIATQVAQGQRRATLVNRLVELTQNKSFGLKGVPRVTDPDDIRVGSPETVTNNYSHAAPSALGPLLAAAALATGIGAPLAIAAWNLPSIVSAMNPPKTVVTPATPGDGNTKYRLRLGRPE